MMSQDETPLELTDFEKDALREIINLAFGDAAAGLAEIMGMYVFLNVPVIAVMEPKEIQSYIEKELSSSKGLNIVEQYYIGKIRGMAFLVMSFENTEDILSVIGDIEMLRLNEYSIDLLAQETLVEIGNIIIGACVSKIAEIMSDNVVYMPPRFIGGNYLVENMPEELFKPNGYVIMLKTIFHFESKDVKGFIFLVNSYDSIHWLKESISEFINKYV